MPQLDQPPVVGQHRVRVAGLRRRVDPHVVGVDRQPRRPGGEAGLRRGVPLHRRPGVVPALGPQRGQHLLGRLPGGDRGREVVDRLDVAELLDAGPGVVRHPELLALEDVRRAPVQVQQRGQRLGGERAAVPPPGDDPRLVVVVPVERVPADVGQAGLPAAQADLQRPQVQRPQVPLGRALVQAHVLELEDHVHLAPRRVGEQPGVLHRHAGHLAHRQQPVPAGEHLPVHLLQVIVQPRAVDEGLRPVRVRLTAGDAAVRQRRVLGDHVDDVHPEAVHAPVQPPPHHRVHGLPDLRVVPVEVGLPAAEQVQVVLPGGLVRLPGRAGEERAPVGRLGPRRAQVHAEPRRAPPVPVPLGVLPGGPGRLEPRVLVGGVVDHQVHEQLHAARVHGGQQPVEVGQRAEGRVDVLVVADVVPAVVLRGRVDRRQPQHVHPEVAQVVQPRLDPAEVPDAVAVGVREAARVDLVDHGRTPPLVHRSTLCNAPRRPTRREAGCVRFGPPGTLGG